MKSAARTLHFSIFYFSDAAFIDSHWHQVSIVQQSTQRSVWTKTWLIHQLLCSDWT